MWLDFEFKFAQSLHLDLDGIWGRIWLNFLFQYGQSFMLDLIEFETYGVGFWSQICLDFDVNIRSSLV
jgi:hypothetical protein